MKLGNSLFDARKKMGLSQEEVASRLGISRQTVSKWELDESIPDIYQSKKLASIYQMSLDELISFDLEISSIEEIIENSDEGKVDKINWTHAWSKKYPILGTYNQVINIKKYSSKIRELLDTLRMEYDLSDLDSMLVLKDILYQEWKDKK